MLYTDEINDFVMDAAKACKCYPDDIYAMFGHLADGEPCCAFIELIDGWAGCSGVATWHEGYIGDPEDNHFEGTLRGKPIHFESPLDLPQAMCTPGLRGIPCPQPRLFEAEA